VLHRRATGAIWRQPSAKCIHKVCGRRAQEAADSSANNRPHAIGTGREPTFVNLRCMALFYVDLRVLQRQAPSEWVARAEEWRFSDQATTTARNSNRSDEVSDQGSAQRHGIDDHMFVRSMRSATHCSQAIQDGHAQSGAKIAVASPAHRGLAELKS
jgi:hypothetical protein